MSTQTSVLLLAGSPSLQSRSSGLLEGVGQRLVRRGLKIERLDIRELPLAPLLLADWKHSAVISAIEQVARTKVIVVATPV